MARGRAKHDAYKKALSLLGKDLARRAKSRCELSEERGSLQPYDLEGEPTEPSLDHVVLVCAQVAEHLEGRGLNDRNQLHYLETAVWNPTTPIRRAAVRILQQIDEPWARDAIENAQSMDVDDDDIHM